ncbi:beta-ribofuranosylaminobenzene 5'-phosphate synthase [Methanobacterium alcaliphilum]|uniref:beta-ribofuranosylaminobenzene 5'-phosphate synthase n=1 Tax=Methanobacterium alcaliphilum TaxID=392018 RepID=UPI00200AE030|nr:beta-ribofuranosylaminobenzene 5'-phosphate synthase [Methanobacterium alcaliphilum]
MIIKTPSRLHLTLIDLNGSIGRIDGGVGITIQEPRFVLKVEPNDSGINIIFKDLKTLPANLMYDYSQKIENASINAMNQFDLKGGFDFFVEETYPVHSGLGSGTQISMAAAKAVLLLNGINVSARNLGRIVGRGGTSGIGVAAFQCGGFIVDGGHSNIEKPSFLPSSASKASPPPLIAHYEFPEEWNIILATPKLNDQVSGKKEVNIFQEFCPIPLREVEKLSHVLLMQMMPAVLDKNIESFGNALNKIQDIGFKKVENDLQHHLIGDIIMDMREAGAFGAGMSSFGPTVFAVTDDNPKNILNAAKDAMADFGGMTHLTKAQNEGAKWYI